MRPDRGDRVLTEPRGPARGGQHRSRGADRAPSVYDLVEPRSPNAPLRARAHPHREAAGADEWRRVRSGGSGGTWSRLVRRWGWRAYAVPLLTVLTVLTVVDVLRDDGGARPRVVADRPQVAAEPNAAAPGSAADGAAAPVPSRTGIFVDTPDGTVARNLPSTALPPGAPFTLRGSGRFAVVPGTSPVSGTAGPLRRYEVEVESGVAQNGVTFAAAVERILGDPRSWGAGGRLRFQRVDSGPVDFRVSITSALTVRSLCGYTLPYETSCFNGAQGRAVINEARWVRGAVAYGSDLGAYRTYVINHEVGHGLGHDHEQCPRAGAFAPVMMQQTLGLTTPGVGACRANPWPHR